MSSLSITAIPRQPHCALNKYFLSTNAPTRFRQIFATSFQWWLYPATQMGQEYDAYECYSHQHQIGWDLLPRGFLAQTWLAEYHRSQETDLTSNMSPLPFMVSMLKVLWTMQLKLWRQYLDTQHQTPDSITHDDKIQEYQHMIRKLHEQRDSCLHAIKKHISILMLNSFYKRQLLPN